jgi:hypothetical protein
MKLAAIALIALSTVIGLVNPAGAFDPKEVWEQVERNLP